MEIKCFVIFLPLKTWDIVVLGDTGSSQIPKTKKSTQNYWVTNTYDPIKVRFILVVLLNQAAEFYE